MDRAMELGGYSESHIAVSVRERSCGWRREYVIRAAEGKKKPRDGVARSMVRE